VPEPWLLSGQWAANATRTHWEAQEQEASRIVQLAVTRFAGTGYDIETARALRGLATDSYPKDLSQTRQLGDLIPRLCGGFLRHAAASPAEERLVNRDDDTKLWLLAALAAKRSPWYAASLGLEATRLSPGSVMAFAGKVGRRMVGD
jgi:hypothetical protein